MSAFRPNINMYRGTVKDYIIDSSLHYLQSGNSEAEKYYFYKVRGANLVIRTRYPCQYAKELNAYYVKSVTFRREKKVDPRDNIKLVVNNT